ncbi:MAG TPA: hypothetical protein VMW91_01520 [Desulfosporosinus sp.]|nr:hypothetical protein [Desulfosporosinus sp.]
MFGLFQKNSPAVLNDRKTYVIVGVAILLGVLEGLGIFTAPKGLYEILPFVGLATLRHAIQKAKAATEDAMKGAQKIGT